MLGEGRAQAVESDSDDEIGDLARAFNQMAVEIIDARLIRRWNGELQQRVDARGELKAAQDQIPRRGGWLRSGRSEPGMAHELNNPVTAISGSRRCCGSCRAPSTTRP